jgi:hypothetical protein
MASQAILELVDGQRDMHFSMTARRVARSSILGTKWLSESTRDAMYRIFQFRGGNAVREFDEEVERQKQLLIREDKIQNTLQRIKDGKTIRRIEDRIDERAQYNTSPHNRKKMRQLEMRDAEKRRKDAYLSEEDKKAELDAMKKDPESGEELSATIEERRAANEEDKQERYIRRGAERKQKKTTAEKLK